MRIKAGRFYDFWRGNGTFISFLTEDAAHLVAFRPFNWHFYSIVPPDKPYKKRWYFGPFEFERTKFK